MLETFDTSPNLSIADTIRREEDEEGYQALKAQYKIYLENLVSSPAAKSQTLTVQPDPEPDSQRRTVGLSSEESMIWTLSGAQPVVHSPACDDLIPDHHAQVIYPYHGRYVGDCSSKIIYQTTQAQYERGLQEDKARTVAQWVAGTRSADVPRGAEDSEPAHQDTPCIGPSVLVGHSLQPHMYMGGTQAWTWRGACGTGLPPRFLYPARL